MSSSSKRKLPLSATVGLSTSEQAGQPGGAPSSSSLKRSKVSFATDTGPLNDDGSLDTGDDADLLGTDLDLEEQDRKRNQQGRKGRVVTEGYDSEDSDEEEEEEEVDAAAQAGDGGEEDDDMFEVKDSTGQTGSKGATAPPAAADTSGKGKGTERYLSLGEIEGQEFQSGATGALSDESDYEDRDPELELEDEDEDEEGEGEDIEDDPVAAGERTPPLSPGGTTVLPRDLKTIRRQKGLKGKAARKQKAAADNGGRPGSSSSGMPAGQQGEGDAQAQMDFGDSAMGFKLEGFNMKSEMTSGRFDEEGNYIPNAKDPLAKYDKWLDGNYSKKGIRAAREAAEKRESEARRREREEEMIAGAGGMEGVMMRLLEYMQRGESVLETLQRLGKEAKKLKDEAKKVGKQQRRSTTQRRNGAAAAAGESTTPAEGQPIASSSSSTSQPPQNGHAQQAPQPQTPTPTPTPSVIKAIETFTSLTSTLLGQFNQVNIYDEEYEGLLRTVRKSGLVAEDWDPTRDRGDDQMEEEQEDGAGAGASAAAGASTSSPQPPGALYEYRWSPSYLQATGESSSASASAVETFGPYDLGTLRAWREAGYFGDARPEGKGAGAERILVRRAAPPAGAGAGAGGEEAGEWRNWDELLGGR